ncbi:hypothetical protein [Pseudooceanicola nanhaiensis]|uniref:DUF4376 domain-containing protein n=1 Tax=Pseudooceanicola nanhaiensis TaxID=375761 RepID=UPI001CD672A6|nr:hypothetical protein [Pseudooceanicola nanhaiensis]MCA0922993.1 hypothetical protein [Pseudooceanicola nanhaiensis]
MPNDWMRTAAEAVEVSQANLKAALHQERGRRLDAGTTLGLSFGSVPVRGRAFDQTIMLAVLQRGAAILAASSSETVTFRDDANTIHELTGAQAVELASAGMEWVEQVMAVSWAMVDSGTIPDDYADDSRWPS